MLRCTCGKPYTDCCQFTICVILLLKIQPLLEPYQAAQSIARMAVLDNNNVH